MWQGFVRGSELMKPTRPWHSSKMVGDATKRTRNVSL